MSRPSSVAHNFPADEIAEALASLQLPHSSAMAVPPPPSQRQEEGLEDDDEPFNKQEHQEGEEEVPAPRDEDEEQLPTIRILVVADIDLPSASALAEYTLEQQRNNNDNDDNGGFDDVDTAASSSTRGTSRIDLCIACGSFVRDSDLMPYLRGKQRRKQQQQRSNSGGGTGAYNNPQQQQQSQSNNTPFFRSRDQTAALEGLMTAALSQLESIVCRVVYCPGATDPITTVLHSPPSSSSSSSSNASSRRLTPNSRNLHQQWLPLAPGIGCAALLYLDSSQQLMNEMSTGDSDSDNDNDDSDRDYPKRKQQQKPSNVASGSHEEEDENGGEDDSYNNNNLIDDDDDEAEEEADDDDVEEEEEDEVVDEMAVWREQLRQMQQSSKGYCPTLDRLLNLPPSRPQHPVPFQNLTAQSILVTHYVDCQPTTAAAASAGTTSPRANSSRTDNTPPTNGTPDRTLEKEEEKEDKPWPAEHGAFLNSTTAQQQLCLEIASGSAARHKPELILRGGGGGVGGVGQNNSHDGNRSSSNKDHQQQQNGGKPVLLPGSLRERGEFCIVEVSLMEESAAASVNVKGSPSANKRTFAWRLSKVDFHTVNHFRQH